MSNNKTDKHGEIIQNNNKGGNYMKNENNKNCTLRILSKKEVYEFLIRQLEKAKKELLTANTENDANKALQDLAVLMNNLTKNNDLIDVNYMFADVTGTISTVRLHDFTRTELTQMLDVIVNRANEIIAEETRKEKEKELAALLRKMADHIPEIMNIING